MSAPRRGEVWLTEFTPVVGYEQAGRRPALVLTVDGFNASPAELVTVLPITGTPRPLPSRIEVRPPDGGLAKVSYIIGEQTRTISTRRLVKPFGMIRPATMAKVETVVRTLLGL